MELLINTESSSKKIENLPKKDFLRNYLPNLKKQDQKD